MKDNFSSIATIIKRFGSISKRGVNFLIHILSVFMSIKGHINFLQLARHSSSYGEQTCGNQFEQFVDFAAINAEYIKQKGSGYYVATFALTYSPKGKPNMAHFTLAYQDAHSKTYHAQVNCVFFKRIISIAFCQQISEESLVKSYKIYTRTDLKMTALLIQKYYQARFQQEFLIRDAKQYTGLQDCQARSTNKIEYHANVALTAINIAKFEHWLNNTETNQSFSMADIKTIYHNHLLMERLFSIFPKQTELIKNKEKIKNIYTFGSIAA